MKTTTKLSIGIGILILVSPLGILLPAYFKAGDGWSEWDLGKFSKFWSGLLPDYAFKGWEEKGLGNLSLAYIVSALVGIAVVVVVVFLIAKLLIKK